MNLYVYLCVYKWTCTSRHGVDQFQWMTTFHQSAGANVGLIKKNIERGRMCRQIYTHLEEFASNICWVYILIYVICIHVFKKITSFKKYKIFLYTFKWRKKKINSALNVQVEIIILHYYYLIEGEEKYLNKLIEWRI